MLYLFTLPSHITIINRFVVNTVAKVFAIDLFRGACAVKGNVQVAGRVKPAPFSRRDVTLGDVDGSLYHIKI